MSMPGAVWLRWVRARLAARPDTEHEQAIVRVVLGAVIVVYLLPGAIAQNLEPTIFVMLGYLALASLIVGHIIVAPGESPARRVLGALADVGTLTWVMAFLLSVSLFLVAGFCGGRQCGFQT